MSRYWTSIQSNARAISQKRRQKKKKDGRWASCSLNQWLNIIILNYLYINQTHLYIYIHIFFYLRFNLIIINHPQTLLSIIITTTHYFKIKFLFYFAHACVMFLIKIGKKVLINRNKISPKKLSRNKNIYFQLYIYIHTYINR